MVGALDMEAALSRHRELERGDLDQDACPGTLAHRSAPAQIDHLAHLARVAVLGELTGAIAHELNQPLTAILVNAQTLEELLARHEPDLGEALEIVRDLIEDDKRASGLIRKLRALLKRDTSPMQPLDVNEAITDVIDLERSDLVGRNIAVSLSLTPKLPAVLADRIQIHQVLLNLLMNACDAMADVNVDERVIRISTTVPSSAPDHVRIGVSDRGPGVAKGQLQQMFEPFFTTKQQGLGLGLSISRSMVLAHGGKLWADNNLDCGLTVYLTLPIAADASTND